MAIRVSNPGFITTVQDLGRQGYAHLGISPAGAADRVSLRIANRLVGNEDSAAGLEMTLLGGTFEFEQPATVAVTGADCRLTLDGQEVATLQAVRVERGSVLQCGAITSGVRTYIAVQGGIDVPCVMGSASTDIGGRFGGVEGRTLKRGDILRVPDRRDVRVRHIRDRSRAHDMMRASGTLRLTRGAQQPMFGAEAFEALFKTTFVVTESSGRTGLRLKGSQILPMHRCELLTDGVPLGAMQVPPDGQPIILFVDQQTTGGYPKIANVIAADLHCVGQLPPKQEVRFSEVSIGEAIDLLRQQEQSLDDLFGE